MHLERQAEFGDISWTREWPAGALFTSAQPANYGIVVASQMKSLQIGPRTQSWRIDDCAIG